MREITPDGSDHLPSIMEMSRQYRVSYFGSTHHGDVVVGLDPPGNLPVSRHAASPDHPPKPDFRNQLPGCQGESFGKTMMLMVRMNEEISTVEGVSLGIMI